MKPKLTYFYTPECPKCKELTPVVKELEQLFEITYVNTFENELITESNNVQWVPTFMLEDQNKKVKWEGSKQIAKFLKDFFS